MAKQNGKASVIDIPVQFGGVSIGQATMSIGITASRESLELNTADDVFCGHRLSGSVQLGGEGDSPGQSKMFDDEIKVTGAFDVKHFSVKPETIGARLTFSKADTEVAELSEFAKKSGRLVIAEVGEIPADAKDDSGDASDEPEELPETIKADGPWRKKPLTDVFADNNRVMKAFAAGELKSGAGEVSLKTMGDLVDYLSKPDRYLTDFKGMGDTASEWAEERLAAFWQANPQE